ncbi:DUF1153 domain-containing protein [Paracoccus aurantiacus]|uniref:DUF1153 domain-containing protein n=1 Tax=Paracoccus aurantiacus TaxID=2599412 RepID=A0A5C6S8D7_9RHOB|nr:DUF1153 domain-containing protein [Paracoccus aurantiacus]TXB70777.1 DUF1153 domain-containing protein [Paracoccus aurantiacus]
MYLRKSTGPRAVQLHDGTILTLADLPPATVRWVASRKALVVKAVVHGLITRQDAIARYGLSDEEFDGWCAAIRDHGIRALRVTSLQKYRQP